MVTKGKKKNLAVVTAKPLFNEIKKKKTLKWHSQYIQAIFAGSCEWQIEQLQVFIVDLRCPSPEGYVVAIKSS